jgi:hypothetical protein
MHVTQLGSGVIGEGECCMSKFGDDRVAPSDWATERFGQKAGQLNAAVPVQLAQAHARAHAVHLEIFKGVGYVGS